MLESGASLYSKVNEAMQANNEAAASGMRIQQENPNLIRGQVKRNRRSDRFLKSRFLRPEGLSYSLPRAGVLAVIVASVFACAAWGQGQQMKEEGKSLELSRAVRPWEFLPVVGMRAGLLGDESGRMEMWVYPLKILREFHLKFHTEGRTVPAEALARTLTVRPESATILYAGDTFRVRETFFVPVSEQGAVILLDVETEQPLEIEAEFRKDFQLEWPAALGATYSFWDAAHRVFYFGEEQRKFVALVGSPTAGDAQQEYQTNYAQSMESAFGLGATTKGKERKLIVIAGSMEGREAAEKTYGHLTADYAELLKESAEY